MMGCGHPAMPILRKIEFIVITSSTSHISNIKIPVTAEGLKAVNILSSKGIKTNVTLIFSAAQALLAARAGATYVSPFVGRLDDISSNGIALIAHIATVPYKVINQMLAHPLTDSGIDRFMKDWNAAFGK